MECEAVLNRPIDDMTLRHAVALRDATLRMAWDHTSVLQATTINLHLAKGKSPVQPSALNPFRRNAQTNKTPEQNADVLDRYIASVKARTKK